MSTINQILEALENQTLPHNGLRKDGKRYKTWGVGCSYEGVNNRYIFGFDSDLQEKVIKASRGLYFLDSETPTPQFILDCKEKSDGTKFWRLKFEFYNDDCQIDQQYSKDIEITKKIAKTLLKELMIHQKVVIYTLTVIDLAISELPKFSKFGVLERGFGTD